MRSARMQLVFNPLITVVGGVAIAVLMQFWGIVAWAPAAILVFVAIMVVVTESIDVAKYGRARRQMAAWEPYRRG